MMYFSYYMVWSVFLFFSGAFMFVLGLVLISNNLIYILDWEFITIMSTLVSVTFIFDWMSMLFGGCVFLISSMVVLYSHSYMMSDFNKVRFLYLVLMFIFSMFMLILSPNMISILLGWDGLGLVSYCLVIYFQNNHSYNAGMLTVLTNRIGDVAILISIAWMLNFGSWHFYYYNFLNYNWSLFLFFLVILAGFTKSAQIPFSSWLPAAMAAPTPVSALVHSSTLVTAGVYLLIRFNDLLLMFDCTFFVMISMMTMFMSGLGANFEFDLKKIIALSTLSQLGLMMMVLFMGFSVFSFFHLLTHAFFKALLFLCAGLIIHIMNDSQDIRHMGSLSMQIPFTMSCFLISNLSLCGFPFLSGFYSKDLILEFSSFSGNNFYCWFILYFSVGLTVSYTFRLIYYSLICPSFSYVCQSYHEDLYMNTSMILLTLFSVLSGSFIGWLIFSDLNFLILTFFLKISSIIFILMGVFFGLEFSFFYNFSFPYTLTNYKLINFLGTMWFMPKFSTYFLNKPSLFFSYNINLSLEKGWGEIGFSKFLFLIFKMMSIFSQFFYLNNVKIYMFSFFLIIILFLIY
uniref:NADH dehydrogenase subunit 5 n=1 Tax=Hermatobates djiboutensis TaxID=301294 RepID=UPI002E77D91A|nr:NADH dehydrogenase subunit 5 [Hermatobates djiboutensis]WPW46691.1 NADH dehydrogenase subunit 5 [Hermatobates djiboutensis]